VTSENDGDERGPQRFRRRVTPLPRRLPVDGPAVGSVIFGDVELRIEHHARTVVLVFADGTRAFGTPEQARDLAKLLLGPVLPAR
jgi:hypothetical protein